MENHEASFEHSGFCRSIQQDHTCFIKDIYEKLKNIEDGFFETESEFQAFFDFVEYGSVNFEENLIYRVITLLKKLDLHVFAIQTLQSRFLMKKRDYCIFHKGRSVSVSCGAMMLNSRVFYESFHNHPFSVIVIPETYSETSVDFFVEYVHNESIHIPLEHQTSVLSLLEFFDCSFLKNHILSEDICINLLRYLFSHSEEESFDSSIHESEISQELEKYLDIEYFWSLPLPILIRIFGMSPPIKNSSRFSLFFEKMKSYHGEISCILLNMIQFSKDSDLSSFIESITEKEPQSVFSRGYFLQKKSYVNQIEDMKNSYETKYQHLLSCFDQLSRDMLSRHQSQETLISEMKHKIEKDRNEIDEYHQEMNHLRETLSNLSNSFSDHKSQINQSLSHFSTNQEDIKNRIEITSSNLSQLREENIKNEKEMKSNKVDIDSKLNNLQNELHSHINSFTNHKTGVDRSIESINNLHQQRITEITTKIEAVKNDINKLKEESERKSNENMKDHGELKNKQDQTSKDIVQLQTNQSQMKTESEKKFKDLDKCYVSQQQYNQTTKSIEESKTNISNLKSEIKRIIKSYPKPSNFEPNIHIAAYKGNLGSVAYLIMNGTNINEPSAEENVPGLLIFHGTPIFAAAAGGHLDIVEYLVQNGADIEYCADQDFQAIIYSAYYGHLQVVEYLIKHHVNIEAKNYAYHRQLIE